VPFGLGDGTCCVPVYVPLESRIIPMQQLHITGLSLRQEHASSRYTATYEFWLLIDFKSELTQFGYTLPHNIAEICPVIVTMPTEISVPLYYAQPWLRFLH
jgi:hypothetical protein